MIQPNDSREADMLRSFCARYSNLTASERRNMAVGWLLSLLRTDGYVETVAAYNEIVYGPMFKPVVAPTYAPISGPGEAVLDVTTERSVNRG